LPSYFGFEGVGILLRDIKNDFLFTILELSKDETEIYLREKFRMERKQRKDKRRFDWLERREKKKLALMEQLNIERDLKFINDEEMLDKLERGIDNEPLIVDSEDDEVREKKEREFIADFVQKFRETYKISFPADRGVSGRVY
jgi:hypothetical protein